MHTHTPHWSRRAALLLVPPSSTPCPSSRKRLISITVYYGDYISAQHAEHLPSSPPTLLRGVMHCRSTASTLRNCCHAKSLPPSWGRLSINDTPYSITKQTTKNCPWPWKSSPLLSESREKNSGTTRVLRWGWEGRLLAKGVFGCPPRALAPPPQGNTPQESPSPPPTAG